MAKVIPFPKKEKTLEKQMWVVPLSELMDEVAQKYLRERDMIPRKKIVQMARKEDVNNPADDLAEK